MNELQNATDQVLLALTNPVPGREEEFERWYWDEHVPEVLTVSGFQSAEKFRLAARLEGLNSHRYATLYHIDGSAAEALVRLYGAGLGSSEALDLSTMVMLPLARDSVAEVLPARSS